MEQKRRYLLTLPARLESLSVQRASTAEYFAAMEALRYPVADADVTSRYVMLAWPGRMQRTIDNTVLMCEWDMSRYKTDQEREQVCSPPVRLGSPSYAAAQRLLTHC